MVESETSPLILNKQITESEEEKFDRPLWTVIPSLWTGAFLAALDSTIIASTYATIGSEFDASDHASWIATSYLLSSTALQPLCGGFSDTFGRKTALLWANSLFLIGSLGCSMCTSFGSLIAARVLAGLGGAGLGTLSSIVVSDLVPLSERSTYNGFANLVFGTGQVVGAPLGGFFADTIGWRWSFMVQCPLTVVSMLVIYFLVDLPKPKHEGHLKDIDFVGSGLLISAVTLSMLLLQYAGTKIPWSSPYIWGTGILVVALFRLFVYVERHTKNPIVLLEVVLSRNPLLCGLTNLFGYMAFLSVTFNVPLYLQVVVKESAKTAGSRLISQVAGMCSGSLIAGFIIRATQHYYWVAVCGVLVEMVASALVATFEVDTSAWKYIAYLFPDGFGHGLIMNATLMALISSVTRSQQAKATSASFLFRSLGSTFGVTLTATLNAYYLQKRLPTALGDVPNSAEVTERIVHSLKYIDTLPEPVAAIARQVYDGAIHKSFYVTVLMEIISLGFCMLIKEFPMTKSKRVRPEA